MLINEIFHGILGESTLAGARAAIVRFTGCNLRCTWCDTRYAYEEGAEMTVDETLDAVRAWRAPHILVTGGEPLCQAAKSGKELLKIWSEMAEGSFLNWYVNSKMPEEAVKDFEVLGREENGLEKQKHLLAELLDKNQLYVNLSEIDDAQFKVSEEDKKLNKAFYGDSQ